MRGQRVISVLCPCLTLVKKLTETEIRVLEKGLGFASTPTKTNETDLKIDFIEYTRKCSVNLLSLLKT